MTIVSGPMFEPSQDEDFESCFEKHGAHYNIYHIKGGVNALRRVFPNGVANEYNLIVFSTSGIHGTYTTIEEIEESLKKYPNGFDDESELRPEDYHSPRLTVLVIHPGIVCMRYGVVTVTLDDIAYLKGLRDSSRKEFLKIG